MHKTHVIARLYALQYGLMFPLSPIFALMLHTVAAPAPSTGQTPQQGTILRLSWDRIAELVRSQGPQVQIAEAQKEAVRASLVGADIYTQTNPVISTLIGEHYPSKDPRLLEYYVRLAWPIDASGSFKVRSHAAQQDVDAAEFRRTVVERHATFAAMNLVLEVRTAADLREFHTRRLELDAALEREAASREAEDTKNHPKDPNKPHDTVASNDVALAHLLWSQQYAALRRASAREEANLGRLKRALGLDPNVALEVPGSLEVLPAPPPREELLVLLARRPDLAEAHATARAAQTFTSLQNRLGIPVPTVAAQGGQVPEFYIAFGLDVPLPIFQRNQTNRAIATANARTKQLQAELLRAQFITDVLAAYASWEGEVAALDSLDAAGTLAGQAERYAQNGYLSRSERITQVLVARRESTQSYTTLVEARLSAGQARLHLAWAAGEGIEQLAGAASSETP